MITAFVHEIHYAQYLAVVWDDERGQHLGNVWLEPIASPFVEKVRVRWSLCSLYYDNDKNVGTK